MDVVAGESRAWKLLWKPTGRVLAWEGEGPMAAAFQEDRASSVLLINPKRELLQVGCVCVGGAVLAKGCGCGDTEVGSHESPLES